jgi:hypothetical protein
MGFHVGCPGAALLQRLTTDPEEFLGAPYAVYVIALATSIDDHALRWIQEYNMALDSLFGPLGAFMLFYNEAHLRVDTPYGWASTVGTQEVDVSARVLRRGSDAVDEVLRYTPERVTSSDVLARSMTYESDAVARLLNITDRLPCLLITDDPRGSEFHIVPLDEDGLNGLKTLRLLLARFSSGEDYEPYFKELLEWHRVDDVRRFHLAQAQRAKASYKYEMRDDRALAVPLLREAREVIRGGNAKQFRERINTLTSQPEVTRNIQWQNLRVLSNRISSIHSVYGLASSSGDVPHAAIQLERLQEKAARVLQVSPAATTHLSAEALCLRLKQAKNELVDELMARVALEISAPPLDTPVEYPWETDERMARRLSDRLAAGLARIRELKRPAIGPYVDQLRRDSKRRVAIDTVKQSMVKGVQYASVVLDAVDKGMKVAGLASGTTL